jgi:uncharacterized membrane-anchored protein
MTTRGKSLLWIGLAVGLQLAILAAVPATKAYTLATGRTIFLKITPVDPYNIMSGYYMTLNYDISRPQSLVYDATVPDEGPAFVVLAEGDDGCWHATSVHAEWPKDVPAGHVVIRGTRHWPSIEYGIESYFVPETMRNEVAADFRKNMTSAKAEVKVDASGRAAIVRLVFGDKVYEY